MAQTSGFYPTSQVKTCFDCKMFDIANWVAHLNAKDGPGQFHLKEHWRYLQSLDSLLPWTETISAHLDWWQNPAIMMKGADLHPKDHRLGHSLRANLYKGSVVRQGKRLHINVLELKAVSLALQRFKDQYQNQTVLVATDNSK